MSERTAIYEVRVREDMGRLLKVEQEQRELCAAIAAYYAGKSDAEVSVALVSIDEPLGGQKE